MTTAAAGTADPPGTTLGRSPRDLLDAVRGHHHAVRAAEVATMAAAIEWAIAHQVGHVEDAAVVAGFGEPDAVPLAGVGAPLISESAVTELALAVGMSSDAGARYLGEVLEIRYRLPRLWETVLAGRCPVWKARRIARDTIALCEEGADFVDAHLAGFARSVSWAQLGRMVEEALTRWDPEEAEERRAAAAEARHVTVHIEQAGVTGTVEVEGTLDLADALDLETALEDRAAELRALGSTESLPVRRSTALGDLARAQPTLDYPQDGPTPEPAGADRGDPSPAPARRRAVVLHVHLAAGAVTAAGSPAAHPVGRLDNTRSPVTAEQIRGWCQSAGKVTVRPVLDLAETLHAAAYEAPDRMREQTNHRDLHCAFPWCTRPAERCDAEHPIPYPAGPTASFNQAPVCRRHHRHKTHLGWTYVVLTPGIYLWRSPHGLRWLRTPGGTVPLDEPPPPPPTPPTPQTGAGASPRRPRRPRPTRPPRADPAAATGQPPPDPIPPPF